MHTRDGQDDTKEKTSTKKSYKRTQINRERYQKLDRTKLKLVPRGKHKNACREVQMFAMTPETPGVYYCQFCDYESKILCCTPIKATGSTKNVSNKCKKHLKIVHNVEHLDDRTLIDNINPFMIFSFFKMKSRSADKEGSND